MVITVYISSVSGSTAIKKQQTTIISYLTSKQIPHEVLDLAEKKGKSSFNEMKEKFLKEVGEDKPFPAPQVFNDDSYCGDYQMFFEANEDGEARRFFKLDSSPTKTIGIAVRNEENDVNQTPETGMIVIAEKIQQAGSDVEILDNKEVINDAVELTKSQIKDE